MPTRSINIPFPAPAKSYRLLFLAVALIGAFSLAPPAHAKTRVASKPEQSASIRSMVVEAKFASLDDARIHYLSYGKGKEALVLIHGWTQNVDSWRDSVVEFAKRNRVIEIDLPGHGKSDKPTVAYSMAYFARAVEAVMRDAKVKRAVLVGHSMGTPIARQFYRKYPDKTLGIVIVDGALRPFGDKAMLDGLMAQLRGPGYRDTIKQMFTGMSGSRLSAEVQERIHTSSLNTPQHVIVGAMEGMADASIWGEDKIKVPVLAIMAKNPFFPPNLEQHYRTLVPTLDFQMWDDAGHFLQMEKPKQFNDAVLAFLDKHKLLK